MAIVAIILVAASLAFFWGSNLADEDLWNHLTFGELQLREHAVARIDRWSYTAMGRPYFGHEWLAEIVFALLFRAFGAAGLLALKVTAGLVAVACILDAGRVSARTADLDRPIHPAAAAAALVLALAAMAPGASFRPQLFTMAFLAIEWTLLERADRRLEAGGMPWALAALPPLMLAWTNMHGGFLVGIGLAGLFVACVLLRAWLGALPSTRGALALVAVTGLATVAATLANPWGTELHRYLGRTLGEHGRITEWLPVPLLSADHLRFKVLVLAAAAVCVPWWWARRAAPVTLVDWRLAFLVVAAGLAFRHQRHTVLFAVAAAPVVLVAAERARLRLLARWPALRPRRPVAVAIAAGALAVAGVQLGQTALVYARDGCTIRYTREEFPRDAVEFLRANGVGGNVATQFEWGGYLLHHLADGARVFIDGRYEAIYPPTVIDDYFAFVEGAPGWERVLDAYPTDVVMLERTAPVHALLAGRPELARVYADDTAIVYLRRTEANAAAIERLTAVAGRTVPTPGDSVFP